MPLSERDEAVMRAFPDLFGRGPWDPSRTAMGYGFGIQEGWRPLLFDLLEELHTIREAEGLEIRVQQVKQKVGELRVYAAVAGPARERVHAAIQRAAERASRTCEFCGQPGQLRMTHPRVGVLCDRCDGQEARRRG